MDRVEKPNNEGFIKTVFPFDDDQKAVLLNIMQYTVLSVIPIIILLRLIKNYVPEADDDKGSLVIFVEVAGQLMAMFIAIYFIHKIVEYVPTYSGIAYDKFNMVNIIATILFVSLTIQSKLGEKVQILADRLFDLVDGNSNPPPQQKGQHQNNVRVTQPISQSMVSHNQYIPNTPPPAVPPRVDPPQSQMTNLKSQTNEYSLPQSPDFNSMYAGPDTPLVNANTPGMIMEPMAANDFLGGGGFGSSF
jgi:hypothetical protein